MLSVELDLVAIYDHMFILLFFNNNYFTIFFFLSLGKSSLMIAMYRMEKLSAGSIFIDGIDISKLKLEVLRNVLGIIPQVISVQLFHIVKDNKVDLLVGSSDVFSICSL